MTAIAPLAASMRERVDASVAAVGLGARRFASLSNGDRIVLAQSMLAGFARVSGRCARAAAEAKGGPPGGRLEAEEWLLGPYFVLRGLRATQNALAQIERTGTTRVGAIGSTVDGRLASADLSVGSFRQRLLSEGHC